MVYQNIIMKRLNISVTVFGTLGGNQLSMPVSNCLSAWIQIPVSLVTIQSSVGRLNLEGWLRGNLVSQTPQHFGDRLS